MIEQPDVHGSRFFKTSEVENVRVYAVETLTTEATQRFRKKTESIVLVKV